jgi:hypothetical protein
MNVSEIKKLVAESFTVEQVEEYARSWGVSYRKAEHDLAKLIIYAE